MHEPEVKEMTLEEQIEERAAKWESEPLNGLSMLSIDWNLFLKMNADDWQPF